MITKYENLTNKYFYMWAIFLPVTSFLVIPSVSGTTGGYLFALSSALFIAAIAILDRTRINMPIHHFLGDIFLFSVIFVAINGSAQLSLSLLMSDGKYINFSNVWLVEPIGSYLFRSSMFTQSLYLVAGILTFLYVKHFYHNSWNRYIMIGATILAGYGLYEWLYYLVFHSNGDFLTNRTFLRESTSGKGTYEAPGSLFQTVKIGGLNLMRLKSLTGEPSMYAFTVLPLWILSIHLKKQRTQLFLLLTLLLTTSTTAYLGIIIYTVARLCFFKFRDRFSWIFVYVLVLIGLINHKTVIHMLNFVFFDKLNSHSGSVRTTFFENHLRFFADLPFFNKLFGVGFGYIRAGEMFTTFLCNIGIIGLGIFILLFLIPVFRLKNTEYNIGLKCALIVILVASFTSIPEFGYLSMWLVLGLAYAALQNQLKKGPLSSTHLSHP